MGAFDQGLISITLPDWPIDQPENSYNIATTPNAQADNASLKLGTANQSSGAIKSTRESGTDLSIGGGIEMTEEGPIRERSSRQEIQL